MMMPPIFRRISAKAVGPISQQRSLYSRVLGCIFILGLLLATAKADNQRQLTRLQANTYAEANFQFIHDHHGPRQYLGFAFTVPAGSVATLRVTELGCPGNMFTVFSGIEILFRTSSVLPRFGCKKPLRISSAAAAYADPSYSKGFADFAAGNYVVWISPYSGASSAAVGYFIKSPTPTPGTTSSSIPEPTTSESSATSSHEPETSTASETTTSSEPETTDVNTVEPTTIAPETTFPSTPEPATSEFSATPTPEPETSTASDATTSSESETTDVNTVEPTTIAPETTFPSTPEPATSEVSATPTPEPETSTASDATTSSEPETTAVTTAETATVEPITSTADTTIIETTPSESTATETSDITTATSTNSASETTTFTEPTTSTEITDTNTSELPIPTDATATPEPTDVSSTTEITPPFATTAEATITVSVPTPVATPVARCNGRSRYLSIITQPSYLYSNAVEVCGDIGYSLAKISTLKERKDAREILAACSVERAWIKATSANTIDIPNCYAIDQDTSFEPEDCGQATMQVLCANP